VAGTPGTLPTNWGVSAPAGLATSVVGLGTENGLPYVDLRINGTATGTGTAPGFLFLNYPTMGGGDFGLGKGGVNWSMSGCVTLKSRLSCTLSPKNNDAMCSAI